ncbi:MAG: hypothetical protein AMXMBFR53_03800 [Gemmatimonadota bacterium]
MHRTFPALLATAFLLAGCQRAPRLETRTFALEHLRGYEAIVLVEPYIYGDREGAPGTASQTDNALTVRETADNLDQIARVLAQFDVPRPDARLRFQLIEADGFTGRDERIAAVEDELRRLFQFRGYRLAGEAYVTATDDSSVEQGLGPRHVVAAEVFLGAGFIRLENVRLWSHDGGDRLTTTVNIRPGQTLVLGSASAAGEDATLLLTVRAEEGPGGP